MFQKFQQQQSWEPWSVNTYIWLQQLHKLISTLKQSSSKHPAYASTWTKRTAHSTTPMSSMTSLNAKSCSTTCSPSRRLSPLLVTAGYPREFHNVHNCITPFADVGPEPGSSDTAWINMHSNIPVFITVQQTDWNRYSWCWTEPSGKANILQHRPALALTVAGWTVAHTCRHTIASCKKCPHFA